jgi:protein transport protein SEC61 subunit gamma-like protein
MADNNKDKGMMRELYDFFRASKNFMVNCEKPDRKEFMTIAKQCALGFLIMGTIGYVIKLIFLMINNILLS